MQDFQKIPNRFREKEHPVRLPGAQTISKHERPAKS